MDSFVRVAQRTWVTTGVMFRGFSDPDLKVNIWRSARAIKDAAPTVGTP